MHKGGFLNFKSQNGKSWAQIVTHNPQKKSRHHKNMPFAIWGDFGIIAFIFISVYFLKKKRELYVMSLEMDDYTKEHNINALFHPVFHGPGDVVRGMWFRSQYLFPFLISCFTQVLIFWCS